MPVTAWPYGPKPNAGNANCQLLILVKGVGFFSRDCEGNAGFIASWLR